MKYLYLTFLFLLIPLSSSAAVVLDPICGDGSETITVTGTTNPVDGGAGYYHWIAFYDSAGDFQGYEQLGVGHTDPWTFTVNTLDGSFGTEDIYNVGYYDSLAGGSFPTTWTDFLISAGDLQDDLLFELSSSCAGPPAPPSPPVQVVFDVGTTTCTSLNSSTTECVTVAGTRTVDNPTLDLFLGYILFFIVMFGFISIFKKR